MRDQIIKIVALAFILTTLGWKNPEPTLRQAPTYYVSPNGSDSNRGTLNRPWRTVKHALKKLSPGDILYLRGGTYYEHEIQVKVSGTAAAPITIQSYPGERAIIDGGVPHFKNTPNSEWKLVDGNIHLYQSRRTFPKDSQPVRAWLVDEGVQLVEYESAKNLESTNYGPLQGFEPLYMGPGLQLRDDGHLYIRLAYNPNDLTDASGNPIAPTPTDLDPNANSLSVSFSQYIFLLDGASYLTFQDLDFCYSNYILDARNESHHVTLSGCRFRYSNQGLVTRGNVHDWTIHDCEFSNGLPDYVYWTDVKNRDQEVAEAYPEFQSAAINGRLSGFHIHHNLFRDAFDGLRVEEGTTDACITENIFRDLRDDSINLSKGISNVQVAHNTMWHVMGGISNLGSDQEAGPVFIHHNIIDNSAYQRGGRPGNYREDNWPVWKIGSPFPGHDDGDKASWWRLYNNTIVSRQDTGHVWSSAGPDDVTGNQEKYVFNNIFYIYGERIIFRDDLASLGSHYDGNVFYRSTASKLPLFSNFGDGGRYASLLDFQTQSGTDWEIHGLEIDPGLDMDAINDPNFDPATIRERYRPSQREILTLGASYEGLDWPGTRRVNYRGAMLPSVQFSSLTQLPGLTKRGEWKSEKLFEEGAR